MSFQFAIFWIFWCTTEESLNLKFIFLVYRIKRFRLSWKVLWGSFSAKKMWLYIYWIVQYFTCTSLSTFHGFKICFIVNECFLLSCFGQIRTLYSLSSFSSRIHFLLCFCHLSIKEMRVCVLLNVDINLESLHFIFLAITN